MHYFPAALLAFLSILSQVLGGKVLVYPLDGSHWVNMKVLIEELHTRGHNLTVLRASNSWYIKEESPFYSSITVYNSGGIEKELLDAFTKHILVIRREKLSFWTHLSLASEVGTVFEEMHRNQLVLMGKVFDNKDLMASLQTAKYDLVLTDPAFGGFPSTPSWSPSCAKCTLDDAWRGTLRNSSFTTIVCSCTRSRADR